jgi:hypothetical protein
MIVYQWYCEDCNKVSYMTAASIELLPERHADANVEIKNLSLMFYLNTLIANQQPIEFLIICNYCCRARIWLRRKETSSDQQTSD